MRSLIRRRTVHAVLALAPTILSCSRSTAPEQPTLPDADVRGTFVLVRAARQAQGLVCFDPIDPPLGDKLAMGLLTFDVARSIVRQEEVRLGCIINDTVKVDQERPIRVIGPLVVVDRPATAAGPVADTGSVTGNTLVLRSNRVDLVYERVSLSDATFTYLTSDLRSWTVGFASFTEGQAGVNWVVSTEPTHFNNNQRLFLFRPEGRPPTGTYQIGNYTSAPFFARMARDLAGGGSIFESTSGTVVVTESTPERVVASFRIDMLGGGGTPTRVEGRFVATASR